MRKVYLRFATVTVALVFALSLAAQVENKDFSFDTGGGNTSCTVCGGYWNFDTASGGMYCQSPDPGNMGSTHCWVDRFPDAEYCTSGGDNCCVD